MGYSRRYRFLVKRIQELENNLLPPEKTKGNYSAKDQDHIRGFRLIAHAEIESFFEDIAEEKAIKALAAWKAKKTKSKILLSLSIFKENKFDKNKHTLSDRINEIVTVYISSLKRNHGIKEENILNILLPLGVEYDEIDPVLVSDLNSFGEERGESAHRSSITHNLLDPIIEKNKVQKMVSEISKLDEIIKKLN